MPLIYWGAILYLISGSLFFLKTFFGVGRSLPPFLFMGTGFALQLLHFIGTYAEVRSFPVGDPYGMAYLIGSMLVLMFMVINLLFGRDLSDFGFLIAVLGFLTSVAGIPAKEGSYRNPFYVYHILSASLAYASIILGGIASATKFLVERKLRTKHVEGLMVPVNLLRKMERILINTGFIFLTLTLIFGSLWAKAHVGSHWINDPKLLLTLILWLYYAFLMHLNLLKGLRPVQLSAMSVIGFIVAVVSLIFIRHTVS